MMKMGVSGQGIVSQQQPQMQIQTKKYAMPTMSKLNDQYEGGSLLDRKNMRD